MFGKWHPCSKSQKKVGICLGLIFHLDTHLPERQATLLWVFHGPLSVLQIWDLGFGGSPVGDVLFQSSLCKKLAVYWKFAGNSQHLFFGGVWLISRRMPCGRRVLGSQKGQCWGPKPSIGDPSNGESLV